MTLQDWLDQTNIKPFIEPTERRVIIRIDPSDAMRKVLWYLNDHNVDSVKGNIVILRPKPTTPAMTPPKQKPTAERGFSSLFARLLAPDGHRRG